MASLYEIDQGIQSCVDSETGEIIDFEKLESLMMEREQKLENVALWVKNLKSELAAIEAEEKAFADRKKRIKAKIESLEKYLIKATEGVKFSTGKVSLGFRSSESVDIPDESLVPKKYLIKTVTYKPDKAAIKNAIKAGIKVKGCSILQKMNLQIK